MACRKRVKMSRMLKMLSNGRSEEFTALSEFAYAHGNLEKLKRTSQTRSSRFRKSVDFTIWRKTAVIHRH
jgi:hypothetical protein